MEVRERAGWWGTLTLGQVAVPVEAREDIGELAPPGGRLAVVGRSDPEPDAIPAAHLLTWLRPRAGGERAYALMARGLERLGALAWVGAGLGRRQVPLVSMGGGLALAATASAGRPDRGLTDPPDVELALAERLIAAMPRRLPPRAPIPEQTGPPGTVLDLGELRRRRRG
jgi:hypothetical protein